MDNNPIVDKIKRKRPNLSQSSLELYMRNLKLLNNNKIPKTLTFLKDYNKIINKIQSSGSSDAKQKTTLTSIVVALKSQIRPNKELINRYSKEMMVLSDKHNEQILRQKRTTKQQENWLSLDEVKEVANKIFNDIRNKKIDKKDILTADGYKLLQEYVILRLYLDFPVRNDLSLYRVHESEPRDDDKNYLIKMNNGDYVIELNKYKTSKTFGQKRYVLSNGLKKLINIFFKHNTSPYLLTNVDRKSMLSRNSLTKVLQDLFMREAGKKIASGMLRHIQAFEKQKDNITLEEQRNIDLDIQDTFLHNSYQNQAYALRPLN